MGKLMMLAAANIRKNKGQTVSLLAFVLIAAVFLQIGLVLYFDYGNAFDERAEELNTPHFALIQSKSITTDEQFAWLNNDPRVTKTERFQAVNADAELEMNGGITIGNVSFTRITDEQRMNPPSFIGEYRPLSEGCIYIPYMMNVTGGYALGDDIKLKMPEGEVTFTIAGFTEEVLLGDMMNQRYRFYVSDSDYQKLIGMGVRDVWLIQIRMNEVGQSEHVMTEYLEEFFYGQDADPSVYLGSRSYIGAKGAKTFMASIIATIVTALALILLFVCLIVMRFGIVNSINEGMTNIGAMKAVGYGNRQIVLSFLLQFGGVTVVGAILGIVVSTLIMPVVANLLEMQSAMVWNPGFNAPFAVITFGFVLAAVLATAFLAARRIFRLHPTIALRGGLLTHSFSKNAAPLDTSHGGLSFLLARKQLRRSVGQSVMITFIIAAVSFASVIGVSAYQNVGVNTMDFFTAMQGEAPDCAVLMSDPEGVLGRVREMSEVRKAIDYDQGHYDLLSDGVSTSALVTGDCSLLEGSMLIEGRYPKHANEIAAGLNFLKIMDKEIGDTVTLEATTRQEGAVPGEYIITGLVQALQNDGNFILITGDSMRTLMPDYTCRQIFIYLHEGENISAFLERVQEKEETITATVDAKEQIDGTFGTFKGLFAALAAAIFGITAVVVTLTLYLVIKTIIIRRKREFGIQKSIGFTTGQIMNQIAVNFIPLVLVGITLGAFGGVAGMNPMFTALMGGMGIARMNLSAPIGWIAAACAALGLLAYGVAMLIAWRIRKISAYALVTE